MGAQIGVVKREKSTQIVDKERKEEGKKTDEAVSNQIKKQGWHKKETQRNNGITFCVHIYTHIHEFMLHEHCIDSLWQTYTTKTKRQMSHRKSSFGLFVCCCFSVP